VRLAGELSQAALLDEYARASVFCLPCRVLANGDRDGIPNVLVEAMATGVPVVTTRVSGIPELVEDGVNGLLVPPDDPERLAAAVLRLHEDDALRSRLAAAGRKTVRERFDGEQLAQRMAALFREALA
jgi:glycosyltransferase involved in cell wall biosynthesis